MKFGLNILIIEISPGRLKNKLMCNIVQIKQIVTHFFLRYLGYSYFSPTFHQKYYYINKPKLTKKVRFNLSCSEQPVSDSGTTASLSSSVR